MTTILQMQIVELAAKGLSNSEIARCMGRSDNHIRVILSYLYKQHGFGIRRGECYHDGNPKKRLIEWYRKEFQGTQQQKKIVANDEGKLDEIALADPVVAKGRNVAVQSVSSPPTCGAILTAGLRNSQSSRSKHV